MRTKIYLQIIEPVVFVLNIFSAYELALPFLVYKVNISNAHILILWGV